MKAVSLLLPLIFGGFAAASPVASPKQSKDAIFVPATNTSVDRHEIAQLQATSAPALLYVEIPQRQLAMSTTFQMQGPAIVLENSDRFEDITCSSSKSSISLTFRDYAAFEMAVSWPIQDLFLITKHFGCNPDNERAVYAVRRESTNSESLTVYFTSEPQTWQQVASKMTIGYLEVGADEKPLEAGLFTIQSKRNIKRSDIVPLESLSRRASSCRVIHPTGYICGSAGSLRSPVRLQPAYHVSAVAYCQDACLANSSCVSFGYGSNVCSLFTKPLINQGFASNKKSVTTFYNRHCFSCTKVTTKASSIVSSPRRTTMTQSSNSVHNIPSKSSTRTPSSMTTKEFLTSTTTTLSPTTTKQSSSSFRVATTSRSLTTTTFPSSSSGSSLSSTTKKPMSKAQVATASSPSTLPTFSSRSFSASLSSIPHSSALTSVKIASTQVSSAGITVYTSSTSSHASTLSFTLTVPTTLDAAQLVIYSSFTSGLSYNDAGTIIGKLPSATASSAFTAAAANATDTSMQDALQNQLQSVGLPSFENVFADISALLTTGSTNSSASNNTSSDNGADSDDSDDSDDEDDSPSNSTVSRRSSRLAKRYSFSDFLDDVDTYACNDFVTSLSEDIEDACDTLEAAESIYCFATGCYETSSAAPPVQYTFDQKMNYVLPGFSGAGYVQKTANSVLSCPNCGMTISNLELQGSIVVDLTSMTVEGAQMNIYQDSVANLQMELTTTAATSGSWSYIMSSYQVSTITASGVFTITPELLYALGARWTTDGAATYSFGHSAIISGATVNVDAVGGYVNSYESWQPNIDATSPSFNTDSSVSLIPFIQSSIEMSIVVLGQTLQNNLILTTQAYLGYSGSLVTMSKLGHTTCPGGSYQALTYTNILNSVSFSGADSENLYKSSGYGTPACFSASISPPTASQISALSAAPSGPAFCTSWIGYTPSTSTLTTTTVAIVATSTVTVTGNGTTTITPDGVTVTATITSSVSSSPAATANAKRTAATSPPSPLVEARTLNRRGDLVARRAVATPTIISSWAPQQVSVACTAIATGVKNITSTATSTTLFGVTTSTVQGTVTAATPTVTANSTVYVPTTDSGELAAAISAWATAGYASHATCSGLSRYDLLVCEVLGGNSGVIFSITADGGSASTFQTLDNLEPGWAYNFTVNTGFDSSTDSCTVTYSLDDDVITSYSPTNGGWDGSRSNPTTVDGPYQVYPTAATQTLTISMTCASAGGYAKFFADTFIGPYVDQ